MDERTQLLSEFRGPMFTEDVPDWRRVWRLVGGSERPALARYGWASVPGLAFLIGAFGCFFWLEMGLKKARHSSLKMLSFKLSDIKQMTQTLSETTDK